jgi:predicted nucleic acid-binding protein
LSVWTSVVDSVGTGVSVPGDRDDDVILATLIVAKADWLVTGDMALLALAEKYPIGAPAEFAACYLP